MRNKAVVIAFGRFNPPTTGHAKLVAFVEAEAKRRGAEALIFASQTQDGSKNPLPFREKVNFLRRLFPQMNWSDSTAVRTPIDALLVLSQLQYDSVYFVVGSDRVAEFQRFANYIKPRARASFEDAGYIRQKVSRKAVKAGYIRLDRYEVLAVPGARDPSLDTVEGMSGSKLRDAVVRNDFETFRAGTPTNIDVLATQIFQSVRRHMGLDKLNEAVATFLFSTSPAAVAPLKERIIARTHVSHAAASRVHLAVESRRPFFVDVSGLSFQGIQRLHWLTENAGYKTTIYLRDGYRGDLTETMLRHQTTYELIKEQLPVIELFGDDMTAARNLVKHMAEAANEVQTPKQPTEVDRMKVQHKQELINQKQRQSQELLQAQQRELQKKSREDQQKIASGSRKQRSFTR